jgi:hypothetical protein
MPGDPASCLTIRVPVHEGTGQILMVESVDRRHGCRGEEKRDGS